MKIILLKDVRNVGRSGEVVEVADGFARNFLIARRFAVQGTPQALKSHDEAEQKNKQKLLADEKSAAKIVKEIVEMRVKFTLPADEKGHLYASLKERDILAKIRESRPSLPESAELVDYSGLKMTGTHELQIRISKSKPVSIKVTIEKL